MLSRRGERLAKGATADVYAFGQDAVVKVLRPGIPESWAGIEAANTAAVHGAGFPAPEVLDVGIIDGRPAVAFRRIVGPSMADEMLADPLRVESLARLLADLQHEIHSATAPATIADLQTRVCNKIKEVQTLSIERRTEAGMLLAELPDGDELCHGDLHPGNVLMGATGPIVIDWFDAVVGCGMADLVRTSLLLRLGQIDDAELPHFPGADAGVVARVHDAFGARALKLQLQATPTDRADLKRWETVLAVSRMAEQVTKTDLVEIWNHRSDDASPSPLLNLFDDLVAKSRLV